MLDRSSPVTVATAPTAAAAVAVSGDTKGKGGGSGGGSSRSQALVVSRGGWTGKQAKSGSGAVVGSPSSGGYSQGYGCGGSSGAPDSNTHPSSDTPPSGSAKARRGRRPARSLSGGGSRAVVLARGGGEGVLTLGSKGMLAIGGTPDLTPLDYAKMSTRFLLRHGLRHWESSTSAKALSRAKSLEVLLYLFVACVPCAAVRVLCWRPLMPLQR